MNRQNLHGCWLRMVGSAKRLWGAVIADETLCIRGERVHWMGQMEIEASASRTDAVMPSRATITGGSCVR